MIKSQDMRANCAQIGSKSHIFSTLWGKNVSKWRKIAWYRRNLWNYIEFNQNKQYSALPGCEIRVKKVKNGEKWRNLSKNWQKWAINRQFFNKEGPKYHVFECLWCPMPKVAAMFHFYSVVSLLCKKYVQKVQNSSILAKNSLPLPL